jgi:CRP-like cAMP-binding protein
MQAAETLLRRVPAFAELDDEVLTNVARHGDLTRAYQGDMLFRQGEAPQALFVLVDGRVSLIGSSSDASSTVIDILEPSSSFVLANVLTDEPYQMSAEVVASSLLVEIAARPMREMVAEHPAAAIAMMRAMSSELANMTRQVVDLKVRVAAQRLGTYLLSLVKDPAANETQFRLPVNKGLLAPWLGCRAENLSRAFMALRSYGVETHGSRVLLHDISRLRAYAGASAFIAPAPDKLSHPIEKTFGDAFMFRRRERDV